MFASVVLQGVAFAAVILLPQTSLAQRAWNDAETMDLVSRAVELRARQIADPALADYTADARGFLTFQGQLTEKLRTPPLLIKATEIAVKLYWMQPGLSKQVIVGMRDSLSMPADIGYYTERYGIVQNNFPDVIRMGNGRDVRDVPHPLSRSALQSYDYRITDSLSIILANQTIDVLEVSVRPRQDDLPRVVGRLYLARSNGAVARMSFTFTRAAFLDERNESLAVTLENGLIEGRFWLPTRQELDLARRSDLLDVPVRTIIRARWEVCCYSVNLNLTTDAFVGPEIIRSSPSVMQQFRWDTDLADALPPDISMLTPAEVRRIRAEAEQMVRTSALVQAKGSSLAARRFSDFVRANRVEGVALGAGFSARSGTGLRLELGGRYGFWDRQPKGRVVLEAANATGAQLSVYAEREYRDVSSVRERSSAVNSLAAPLFGNDYSDQYDVRAVGIVGQSFIAGSANPRLEASWQRHDPLAVNMDPLTGTFGPVVPADRLDALVASLQLNNAEAAGPFGSALRWNAAFEYALVDNAVRSAAIGSRAGDWLRARVDATVEAALGKSVLALSAFGALATSEQRVPAQRLIYIGGPISAPGYSYHELVGEAATGARAEFRFPVPFPSISLGRYGRSPATATIAPYVAAAYIDRVPEWSPRKADMYPSAGVGASFLFDLVRVDIARGLNSGRWIFSVDALRELWDVM